MRPHGGGLGWRFPDLDGGTVLWFTNPKFHIRPEHDALIDLFFSGLDGHAWANGASGIGALRHLPDAGGLNDQSAAVLDALRIIAQAVREVQGATGH